MSELEKAVGTARHELKQVIAKLTEALMGMQVASTAADESAANGVEPGSSGAAANPSGGTSASNTRGSASAAAGTETGGSGVTSTGAASGGARSVANGGSGTASTKGEPTTNGGPKTNSVSPGEEDEKEAAGVPPEAYRVVLARAAEATKHVEALRAATLIAVSASSTVSQAAELAETKVSLEEKAALTARRDALRKEVLAENARMKVLIDHLRDLRFFLHSLS